MELQAVQTFFLLICGHAFADFSLQTDFIATFKDPKKWEDLPKESSIRFPTLWIYLMTAHTLQHGAIVFLITHSLPAALLEIVVHFASDYAKCRHWINFHVDQLIHVLSKVAWVFFVYPLSF